MKLRLYFVLLLATIANGQNPNTPAWPASVATDTTLLVGSNNGVTTLSAGITNSQTTIPLASATNFISPTSITIDAEVILCTGLSGTTYSGCTRGWSGTTPAIHLIGSVVYENQIAWYHNQLAAEIKAIETVLGAGMLCSAPTGVNVQSGTTYTVQNADGCTLVSGSNAAAQAYTLPQPGIGGQFTTRWATWVENTGSGLITLTPVSSVIDGQPFVTIATNQGMGIFTDGMNYYTFRGVGSGTAAGTVTHTVGPLGVGLPLQGNGGGDIAPFVATLGSVYFAGVGGLISQDNANFFYNPTSHHLILCGTTDGNFRFDIQCSGSAGTVRLWDQTTMGFTTMFIRAGSGQSSASFPNSNLLNFEDSGGCILGYVDNIGQVITPQLIANQSGIGATTSVTGNGPSMSNLSWLGWSSNGTFFGTQDTRLFRSASGAVEVNNGTSGQRYGTVIQAGSGLFYDNTPSSGVTTVTFRGGANQTTTPMWLLLTNSGGTGWHDGSSGLSRFLRIQIEASASEEKNEGSCESAQSSESHRAGAEYGDAAHAGVARFP